MMNDSEMKMESLETKGFKDEMNNGLQPNNEHRNQDWDTVQESGVIMESYDNKGFKDEVDSGIQLDNDHSDEVVRNELVLLDMNDKTLIIQTNNELKTNSSLSNNLINSRQAFLQSRTSKFLFYALGICCVYFMNGILTERLLKGSFGPNNDQFDFIFTFVFIQCVVNYAYAEFLLCTMFKSDEDTTPSKYYALAAFTNFLSMFLSNKSLHWISYPTQVLAKSMRPIPVMIFNVLFGKQRYSFKKYCFVVFVVMGVSLFMIKRADGSKLAATHFNFGWGELCVSISLILDGITGAVQERMKQEYETKSGYFMANINKWSSLYLGLAMLGFQEFLNFIRFLQAHPITLSFLGVVTVCSALGQMFIYLMISQFGTLSCSLVTTTRKFFTILGSIIIFRHTMSHWQWFSTGMVFLGLTLDTYFSHKEEREEERKRNLNLTNSPL
uniref:Solute carrier family 35 member B1 homolog n=1 Tax=Cacopsylla melanoneura TaxID=428564 RepID=A0A8D8T2F1_9HEMI